MNVTVEISMYPLRSDYEEQVLKFIDLLKEKPDLRISVNAMSTQITGQYDEVLNHIQFCIKAVYQSKVKASFAIKILPGALDLDFDL